jgi:hypothetical protein
MREPENTSGSASTSERKSRGDLHRLIEAELFHLLHRVDGIRAGIEHAEHLSTGLLRGQKV